MKLLPPSPGKTRSKSRKNGKGSPQRDPATGRVFGGNPGNRGGGRPTSEFKRFLETDILGSETLRKNLQLIADSNIAAVKDPQVAVRLAHLVLQLAAWAADRVEGKATQPVRVLDATDEERLKEYREMSNEELIANLKTIDSDTAHQRG